MLLKAAALTILAISNVAHASWLEPVGKNLWKDRSEFRCYSKSKVQAASVKPVWRREIKDTSFYLPPVLAGDSLIAVSPASHAYFFSIKKGELSARTETLGDVETAPLVLSDGTVAIVNKQGRAYFFTFEGDFKGDFEMTGHKFLKDGAAVSGDTLVLTTRDSTVFFLKSDGRANQVKLSDDVSAPPVVRPDGVVVVGTQDKAIHFYDKDGLRLKRVKLDLTSPARAMSVSPDNELAVMAFPGHMTIFDRTARAKSYCDLKESVDLPPTFLPNSRMAVSMSPFEEKVLFINQDCTNYVSVNFGHKNRPMNSPLKLTDDLVAITTWGGELRVVETSGFDVPGRFTLGNVAPTRHLPVAMSDGTVASAWEDGALYIVATDGKLSAKYQIGRDSLDAKLLALPDNQIALTTNDGHVMVLKPDASKLKSHTVWNHADCPSIY